MGKELRFSPDPMEPTELDQGNDTAHLPPPNHGGPKNLGGIAQELADLRQEQAEQCAAGFGFNERIWGDINRLRTNFHHLCKKKKKEWAIKTLHEAKSNDIWGFRNWPKGSRNYPTPPIRKNDGTYAVSHSDKCEAVRQELYQPPPPLPRPYTPDLQTHRPDELPFADITEEEVYEAIHKNSTNTAPGHSQITYECLKWAWTSEHGRKYTVALMRKCLQAGYHPKSWRQAVAVALRKPNKPDYSNPRAYRLITLLECLGKVLERIIARRLTYLAGKYNLVPPNQFGGRSSSSTVDALLSYTNDIQSAWNHGYATTSLTFDIKGYFDFVNHDRLLSELVRKRIPIQYVRWVSSFLSDREAAVCLDGKVGEMKPVQNGIPQGSPISPILAAFYTTELLEMFQGNNRPDLEPHPTIPTSVNLMMYVDDGNLYVSSPSLDTNIFLLQEAYRQVHTWLLAAGLSADPVKRELMHYCKPRSKKFTNAPHIQLCDAPDKCIPVSPTVRWLGVYFDRHLRFEQHAKLLATAGEAAVNGLLMLANTVRGLSQIHLRRLYLACIIPKILYASPVWWNNTSYQRKPLEKVQNRALRLICAAFKTSPIRALELEASIPPLHIHNKLLSRRCAIRFNKLPDSSPIIRRLGKDWLSHPHTRNPSQNDSPAQHNPPLPPQPIKRRTGNRRTESTTLLDLARYTDYRHERIDPFLLPPWRRLQSSFDFRIVIDPFPSFKGNDAKKKAADQHTAEVRRLLTSASNLIVYTDGSLVRKAGFTRVGAGVVLYHQGREVKNKILGLGGHAEVFDGEMAALAMGMNLATNFSKNNPLITSIHFFVDNVLAASTIFNPRPTGGQRYAHSFYRLATRFLDANKENKISVRWCPSHCGVRGNERADRLAKQATSLPSYTTTTRTNAIRRAKLAAQKEWAKEWRSSPQQGWFAVSDRMAPSLKPTKHARRLANQRELYGRIVQTRTGHAYTGEFRRRFALEGPYVCPCDNASLETREHILIHCPRFERWRARLQKASREIVLSEILGTDKGLKALEVFLRHSDAFKRPVEQPLPTPPNEYLPAVDGEPPPIDNG
ncbi:hypothetical protein NMY22_g14182 [Coprinellus aureogranulatus]|nr:hypothetical protein NMY22_g14182 [Coprinellus aureogranulatus]